MTYFLFAGYADTLDGVGDCLGEYETIEEAKEAAPVVYWANIVVFEDDVSRVVSSKLFTDRVDRWHKVVEGE